MINEPTQVATNPSGDECRCGYTVALTKDGKLIFKTEGDDVGLIQLLGLHALAGSRIKGVLDLNQRTGDAISVEILRTLQNALLPAEALVANEPGEKKGGE
jgi:hypothetical protein